jgi:hypothetical protein
VYFLAHFCQVKKLPTFEKKRKKLKKKLGFFWDFFLTALPGEAPQAK